MPIELIPAAKISSSGLKAEKMRMEIAANNLANVNSTRPKGEGLYQRQEVVFKSVMNNFLSAKTVSDRFGGVQVDSIVNANREAIEIYNPGHPHADEKGMLKKPDISPIEEMVDMMTAARAYEANLNAMKQSKEMAKKMLQFVQG